MESLQEYVNEYRKQLELGAIQVAYKGLMQYCLALKTHFNNKYPDYSVPGNIYSGYMDMTYFSLSPKHLKDRKLKIAVVFLHETCRFEVWLAGVNKQVQTQYWQLLKESGWDTYPLVASTKGADAIMAHVLVDRPDFNDLGALTKQIESETVRFIEAVESFLSSH